MDEVGIENSAKFLAAFTEALLPRVAAGAARVSADAILFAADRLAGKEAELAMPGLCSQQGEGSRHVAVLLPGRWPYWEVPVFNTISSILSLRGCRISLGSHLESPAIFVREFRRLTHLAPDGILLVPPPAGFVSRAFSEYVRTYIRERHVPVVALDRELGSLPCAQPNHQEGGRMITESLLRSKPRTVVLVTTGRTISSMRRALGFEEAISNGRPKGSCEIIRVELGIPRPLEHSPGTPRLVEVLRGVKNRERVGFVAVSPNCAHEIVGEVETLLGAWPRSWGVFHYDGVAEGGLMDYRPLGRGPECVGGCRIDRGETAFEAAKMVLDAMGGADLMGKTVFIKPQLEVA